MNKLVDDLELEEAFAVPMAPKDRPKNCYEFCQMMVGNLDYLAKLAADNGDHAEAATRKFDSRYLEAELRTFKTYQDQQRGYVTRDFVGGEPFNALFASDYTPDDLDQMERLIQDMRDASRGDEDAARRLSEHLELAGNLRDTLHRETANADRYNADHTEYEPTEILPFIYGVSNDGGKKGILWRNTAEECIAFLEEHPALEGYSVAVIRNPEFTESQPTTKEREGLKGRSTVESKPNQGGGSEL